MDAHPYRVLLLEQIYKALVLDGQLCDWCVFSCFSKWRTPEIFCFHPMGPAIFIYHVALGMYQLCDNLAHKDRNQIIILSYLPLLPAIKRLY